MSKEKVVVVSSFFDKINTCRPYLAYLFFKKQNYDTTVIYSDFNHWEKKYKVFDEKQFIPVRTRGYKKNISIARVISHILFSMSLKKVLKREKPDIIYVNVPPNICGFSVVRYAKKNNIKVIVDVVDVWPETFGMNSAYRWILDITVNRIWRGFRNYSLKNSTCAIAESGYFKEKFMSKYSINVVYLTKSYRNYEDVCLKKKDDRKIVIGYVGSISHIYDFDSLIEIATIIKEKTNKQILIKIIGRGEKLEALEAALKKKEIDYIYYGVVYDEQRKKNILEDCDFGFNGYKKGTEIALSYKSIDYFSYGIPILNSAKGDTFEIIEKYNAGINYDDRNLLQCVEIISNMSVDDINKMKYNSKKIYNMYFTMDKYIEDMNFIVSNIK